MCYNNKVSYHYFDKSISFLFSKNLSSLFIKGKNGIIRIHLPSYYFYSKDKSGKTLKFLFLKKFYYRSFFKHLSTYITKVSFCYFLKLRLRGLGFRIRSISKNLCFFYFNYINNFYFHVPYNIIIKPYKKRLFLFSNDWSKLRLVFTQILLLKKLGPYTLMGIKYKRQVLILKKLEKKF